MFDRHSTLLTWGGHLGVPQQETWQCGVHLALDPSLDGPGVPTTGDLHTLLVGPLLTFHQLPANWISADCSLGWAKCASLDPDGAYSAAPVYVESDYNPGGSTAPNRGAPQVAMCVTLNSGGTLGKANFGRFYWAWWEAQVQDDGRVADATMESTADAAKALIDGINSWAVGALSATARVRIMSKQGAGTTKLASHVRVGNVKDTQRRRRRSMGELYYGRAVA